MDELTHEQQMEVAEKVMDYVEDGMSKDEAQAKAIEEIIGKTESTQAEEKFTCKDCGAWIDNYQNTYTNAHTGKPLCKEHYADFLKATGYDPCKPGLVPDDFKADEDAPTVGAEVTPPAETSVPATREVSNVTAGIDAATIPHFTDEQIDTIKNTVAKGATTDELAMFMHLCNTYGLDPFLKEIYYSSDMKTILTSRDGYLKIAQRHPEYEGMQSMGVCENDDFEIDIEKHTVRHKFGKGDRGNVIGAWAIVYRKGRKPVISYADYNEYKRSSGPWTKYRSAMCCKVAESFALKRQFGISGLVTSEEMGAEVSE